MPDLEPITREEMLLDGQDLEPITRKEMFIKRIYDKTQVVPKPITREEMFLKKAGDETTDVTIEQLNVSANGTYSESGKAYSPVIVNVPAPPIPDNAYLLNEVEGLPKDIATFSDGSNLPMPSLKVGIEPIQEGSGDPSPSNVRPISGWSEANVSVCGTNVWDEEWVLDSSYRLSSKNYIPVKANTEYFFGNTLLYSITCYDINKNSLGGASLTQVPTKGYKFTTKPNTYYIKFNVGNRYGSTYNNDISINYPATDTDYHAYIGTTYHTDLPETVYGGTLDVVSGELVVDRGILTLNGSEDYYTIQSSSVDGNTVLRVATGQACKQNEKQKSNYGTFDNYAWQILDSRANTFVLGSEGNLYLQLPSSTASTVAEFKALFASNPLQLVYELSIPTTIQLTPTQVKSLLGSNNVWCDTGKIEELEYFSKEA